MKKKSLTFLLAISMLSLCACGTSAQKPADNGTTDAVPADETASEETGAAPDSDTNAAAEDSDTSNESQEDESSVTVSTSPTIFSVTYETKTDELTADDGTVILISTVEMPTLASEEAADIALKINDDMAAYLNSSGENSEIVRYAQEDYQNSNGEDGWTFSAYTNDILVQTTRMDDNVISFKITYYSYAGGAHGNYVSIGRSYNAQTGEQIISDDLTEDADTFRSTALDYLVTLAESSAYKNRLFPNMGSSEIESTLFAADKWFFSNTGITFISDPYALGPYAAGTIYFTIPYGEAVNMGLREAYDYFGNYTQERYYTYAYDEDGNPSEVSGDTEYTFDLNGDGADETIAFYGFLYSEDGSTMSLYINGEQLGETITEQIDPSTGYLDSTYVLYDLDPADDFIEIGVLFSVIDSVDKPVPYTYFFRYTTDNELIYLGSIEGYASGPEVDFESFVK